MRTLLFGFALAGCSPIPLDGDGDMDPVIIANTEATGEEPDAPTQFVRGVVAFAPEADAAYPFAFNGTGVPVSVLPQLPAMTPFLPRPVDEVSMELLSVTPDATTTLATTGALEVDGTLEEVILYGSFEAPRGVSLSLDDAPVEPGSLTVRLVHLTPDLPYVGLAPPRTPPVLSAFEEGVSEWITLEADVTHSWLLDVNGDGVGDLPYSNWQLPPTDGLGRPQVVEIFVVPSGETLPAPFPPLPVPVLVITPLTGPDEAISSVPLTGG